MNYELIEVGSMGTPFPGSPYNGFGFMDAKMVSVSQIWLASKLVPWASFFQIVGFGVKAEFREGEI